MQCEICGKVVARGLRVLVEGSSVVSCEACAGYGKVVGRAEGRPKKKPEEIIAQEKSRAREGFKIEEEWSLIDDCGEVLRKAREQKGLKQDEIAKMINEPASLIHRIESGRIVPSPAVAKKISKKLGVRLYERGGASEVAVPKQGKEELTLGDVIVVRKGGEKG